MSKNKKKDILPKRFKNVKEASEFWDTHDSTDYEEYMKPVKEEIIFEEDYPFPVYVESELAKKIHQVASKKGISVETLVNLWLEEKLLSAS